MDINRLEEFITLAYCLNYTRAANLLYLTQPVLSRHIHDLELALGAPLFIRDTHQVTLTPFGELAKDEITTVLEVYHRAMRNIKLANENVNGHIMVGFLGEAVRPFITQFIQYLGESQLQVDYTSVTELDTLISLVDDGTLDLGFITHIELNRLHGIEVCKIADDPLYVAMAPTHPLANRESLTIQELSGLPAISYDRETNPHTAIFHEKLFKRFGAEYNIVRKVRNLESGLFYVSLGAGFFVIPSHLRDMARDLALVPVSNKDAFVSLRLIWKKDNAKPSVKRFVKEFSLFYKQRALDLEKSSPAHSSMTDQSSGTIN